MNELLKMNQTELLILISIECVIVAYLFKSFFKRIKNDKFVCSIKKLQKYAKLIGVKDIVIRQHIFNFMKDRLECITEDEVKTLTKYEFNKYIMDSILTRMKVLISSTNVIPKQVKDMIVNNDNLLLMITQYIISIDSYNEYIEMVYKEYDRISKEINKDKIEEKVE